MIAGRSFAASAAALVIFATAILTTFAIVPARAAGPFLFDVMKQPAYRKAYLAIFAGAKDLPPRLAFRCCWKKMTALLQHDVKDKRGSLLRRISAY
ncbi:MAG: hypothetical protein ACLP8A_03270 [Methylovirgula sp.]